MVLMNLLELARAKAEGRQQPSLDVVPWGRGAALGEGLGAQAFYSASVSEDSEGACS